MKTIEIDLDVYKQIEAARSRFDEPENAILHRLLSPAGKTAKPAGPPVPPWPFMLRVGDKTVGSTSLNDAFLKALKALGTSAPTAFKALSGLNYPRGKILSRNKEDLFKSAPHLRQQFARPVGQGYFADANLSKQQITSRLRRINHVLRQMDIGPITPLW